MDIKTRLLLSKEQAGEQVGSQAGSQASDVADTRPLSFSLIDPSNAPIRSTSRGKESVHLASYVFFMAPPRRSAYNHGLLIVVVARRVTWFLYSW